MSSTPKFYDMFSRKNYAKYPSELNVIVNNSKAKYTIVDANQPLSCKMKYAQKIRNSSKSQLPY